MTTEQNNHVLTAINAVMVTFTQQIVEQATKPMIERIARLEQQQEELYDIIGISLKGHVNNAVNISIAAVKQGITKEVLDIVQIEVLKANIIELAHERIKTFISGIKVEDITGFSEAVEEVLQNQPPLNADDIDGLRSFVEGVIEESDSDLESTIREEVESQLEQNDPVERIKQALRDAADSI